MISEPHVMQAVWTLPHVCMHTAPKLDRDVSAHHIYLFIETSVNVYMEEWQS
jgi:hypothetical protein